MSGRANGGVQINGAEGRHTALRPMHISLRAGERLFLNGAVLRADKKVTLELLNDATFLLENHVLQVEDTHTPMRQLYFAVQAMLMDPQNAAASRNLFETMADDVQAILTSPVLQAGVAEAVGQVEAQRPFHALKTLRALFGEESKLLADRDGVRAGQSAPATQSATADAKAQQGASSASFPDPIAINRTRTVAEPRSLRARN